MKREIGTFGLTSNIINSVIGAGIFVLPAIVSLKIGAYSIYAYLFCGVLISFVMLCFAELGSQNHSSGGPYTYIEKAFGKYAGFLATNLFIFGVTVLANAAIANAFVNLLALHFSALTQQVPKMIFLFMMFSGLAFLNIWGVKQGITLVLVTTILKLIPLLVLLVIGLPSIRMNSFLVYEVLPFESLGSVTLILFFAFQGAENGLTIGEEIQNPARTVPRAILYAFVIILFIYINLQLITQTVLGTSLLIHSSEPLIETARRLQGPAAGIIVLIGMAVSMFGYLSGDFLNLPRVLFAASRDGVLPVSCLSRTHSTHQTPANAIALYSLLCFIFSTVGDFRSLAVISSASILIIYLGIALSVIKIRITQKSKPLHSFSIPGGYSVPVITTCIIIWLLSNLSSEEKWGIALFIVVLSFIYLASHYLKKL